MVFTQKAIKVCSCNRQTSSGDQEFQWDRQWGLELTETQHQSETQWSSWLVDLPPGRCHKWSASGRTVQRVGNPPLVKTCQEGGGKQRQGMRNWGKGQAWVLQLLLWNWTWMSCRGTVVFQRRGLGCHLWQRGWSQCACTSAVQPWLQFSSHLIVNT